VIGWAATLAHAGIAGRLDAIEAELEQAADARHGES